MNADDRRSALITVRLTGREKEVVERLCSEYGCSKSLLLRMLYTLTLPSVVPELNLKALGVLDHISFQLGEMANADFSSDPQLNGTFCEIESALDRLRTSLLEAP